jgi:hypothetical protein
MRRETKASVQQILLQAMKRYVSGPSADTPRTGASIG